MPLFYFIFRSQINCTAASLNQDFSFQDLYSVFLSPMSAASIPESHHIATWAHHAWLWCGCAAVLLTLAKSIILIAMSASTTARWLEAALSAVFGYIVADLATGIYHWVIDNYGSFQTPILGSQIEASQSHHQQPWDISKREIAYNIRGLAAATAVGLLPSIVWFNGPIFLAFAGVFTACVMFCQQFHAWAHRSRGKTPPLVAALQDAGILVGRHNHAKHHRPPYNGNYCIVSGMLNGLLDRCGFFTAMEILVFRITGVSPRSQDDQ